VPHLTRLKKLLLAVALLAGSYLLGANLFLNTPVGPWAVNRRPQRFQVRWDRAWTLLPGRLQVRGLRIEGHAGAVDWWVAAERGSGWIDLPGLFVRRFRVTGFSADGVRSSVVSQVRRPEAAAARRPAGARGRPRWLVEMRGVSLSGVRSIGWNGFRLEGGGTARGAFSLRVGGDFALSPTSLWMPGARLLFAEETVVRDLDVRSDLRIDPYTPRRHPGVAGFDFISGRLQAHGTSAAGDLTVDVHLEQGRLTPGSRASLRAGNPLTALLAVETGAAGPRLVLRADAQELALGTFAAAAFHLEAATAETRFSRLLARGRELRQGGRLPAGALQATFNAAGLRLAGSGQRLAWQIAADRAAGWIDLPALLHRELLLDRLQADGLSARAERTREKPRPAGQRELWTVRVSRARLTAFRELAFNDFRGDLQPGAALEAAGSFALDPDGTFALDDLALRMSGGRLLRNGKVLIQDLAVTTAARLGPAPLQAPRAQPGLAALDTLSGSIDAHGKMTAVPFLNLGGRARSGDFTLGLRMDHGRLAAGSRLAAGAGSTLRITGTVGEETPGRLRLLVAAEARGLSMGGGNGRPPVLQADSALLHTQTPETRLRRLLATADELRAGRPAAGEPLAGEADVRGLRMNGAGERIAWQLTAERARGRIDLPALLERRAVLSGLRIEGAAAQADPAPGPPPPPGKRWTLEIRDARIEDLRSLAYQTDRIAGPGRLEGSLTLDSARLLTVHRATLTIPRGRLESGRAPVARNVKVRADLRVHPFVPGAVHGAALLRLVSGGVAVQGQVSSLGFLHRFFEKTPWLQVQGQGRLDADLQLNEGRLLPGSRLDVRGGKVQAVFLDSVASGEATISGWVGGSVGSTAALDVDFSNFGIAPLPAGEQTSPSYIQGAGLRLAITSTDLDLATPVSDLQAVIDLPDSQVPDLTVYNTYLPPGTGVSVLAGSGRLRLHLALNAGMDAATQSGQGSGIGSGQGEVLLTSDAARVRFQDVELAGNLMLRARLTSRDLKARRFQVAGTRLDLDRVTYREIDGEGGDSGAGSPGWWAHLQLTGGSMVWGRPLSLQSTALLEMKNSGFLLSVFARRKSFLRWFHRLLSVEDVRAEGSVRCGDGAIEIAPLRVTGGRLDLRSRLRFTRENKQGDLFIRWGKLAAGIELRDGKRTFKLRRPEAWFESGQEEPLTSGPAASRRSSAGRPPDR
jgi:hypothetical protein